ncbi:MAG: hypothetical protein ACPHGV_10110 [Synechococcus sp.]
MPRRLSQCSAASWLSSTLSLFGQVTIWVVKWIPTVTYRLLSLVSVSAILLVAGQISALSVAQTDQKLTKAQQFPASAPAELTYVMTYKPIAAD